MRILISVPYSVDTSGTVLFALPLSNALSQKGVQSDVAVRSGSEELDRGMLQEFGVAGQMFPSDSDMLDWVEANAARYDVVFWGGFFVDEEHRRRQIQQAKAIKDRYAIQIVFLWERTGFEVVVPEKELLEVLVNGGADTIAALNQGQREQLASMGFADDVISLFTPGIDTDRFFVPTEKQKIAAKSKLGFEPSDTVMFSLARFVERKRIDFIVETWKSMHHIFDCHGRPPQLLLLGSGFNAKTSNEEKVVSLASDDPSVKVVLFEAGIDRRLFYHAADVFVTASRFEGEPQAVQEAMACGLPILASDIEGHRDLVSDGQTGYQFPVDDQTQLAELIRFLSFDSLGRVELGKKARRMVVQQRSINYLAVCFLELVNRGRCSETVFARNAISSVC